MGFRHDFVDNKYFCRIQQEFRLIRKRNRRVILKTFSYYFCIVTSLVDIRPLITLRAHLGLSAKYNKSR